VFVTGGMWIIGYKAWGALLARSLMKQGFIVASLDYRNFPQGTVGEMIQDVGCGIGWVVKRAVALGGDPNRVVVVGQSAGAHLSATAILRQAEWELSGYGLASAWSPSSLAGFVGVSGVYNPDDQGLVNHFHRRGLHKEVFHSIMEAGYSGRARGGGAAARVAVRHPTGPGGRARARREAAARVVVPRKRGHVGAAERERQIRQGAESGWGGIG
jgi:prenylcysteine alpha-carboxyl methylesterase